MKVSEFLESQAVLPQLRAATKKQLLTELGAASGEQLGIDPRRVFETLFQREKLGSTGLGQGIAIPHGKIAKVKQIFGVFARLERPIDFEAQDSAPVDLIFLLIAPESAGADRPARPRYCPPLPPCHGRPGSRAGRTVAVRPVTVSP